MFTRTQLIASLVTFTIVAPPAHAARFQVDLTWQSKLARFETRMRAPGPAGQVVLIHGICPGWPPGTVGGCTYPDGRVYLTTWDPYALAHELGHVFDQNNLDDAERARLGLLLAGGQARISLKSWSDCGTSVSEVDFGSCSRERFADAYAGCALGMKPEHQTRHSYSDGNWNSVYDWWPSWKLNRRVCKAIARYVDV